MTFGFKGQVEESLEEAVAQQYGETGMFAEINVQEIQRPMKLADVEKYTETASNTALHELFQSDRSEVSAQISQAVSSAIMGDANAERIFTNWKPSEDDITSVMMAALIDEDETAEEE